MKKIVLSRGGIEYIFRIGVRKADYIRFINGDADCIYVFAAPEDAEDRIKNLKDIGFVEQIS